MNDYLIAGAGLYGATCARELTEAGHSVILIEKRGHIAGNAFTETIGRVHAHRYGAYVFHTNDASVSEYVQHFADFNRYTNFQVVVDKVK